VRKRPGTDPGPGALISAQNYDHMIAYVQGYTLALEDIIEDNQLLVESQPGYKSPWQLIKEVERSLTEARRTLEILHHDQEVGGYPDEA
jgi:hypothetical protein